MTGRVLSVSQGRVGKGFFFEKKKQKTFKIGGTGVFPSNAPTTRSFFASFFTKKEVLAVPSLRVQSP
jgi:hypothetical protein